MSWDLVTLPTGFLDRQIDQLYNESNEDRFDLKFRRKPKLYRIKNKYDNVQHKISSESIKNVDNSRLNNSESGTILQNDFQDREKARSNSKPMEHHCINKNCKPVEQPCVDKVSKPLEHPCINSTDLHVYKRSTEQYSPKKRNHAVRENMTSNHPEQNGSVTPNAMVTKATQKTVHSMVTKATQKPDHSKLSFCSKSYSRRRFEKLKQNQLSSNPVVSDYMTSIYLEMVEPGRVLATCTEIQNNIGVECSQPPDVLPRTMPDNSSSSIEVNAETLCRPDKQHKYLKNQVCNVEDGNEAAPVSTMPVGYEDDPRLTSEEINNCNTHSVVDRQTHFKCEKQRRRRSCSVERKPCGQWKGSPRTPLIDTSQLRGTSNHLRRNNMASDSIKSSHHRSLEWSSTLHHRRSNRTSNSRHSESASLSNHKHSQSAGPSNHRNSESNRPSHHRRSNRTSYGRYGEHARESQNILKSRKKSGCSGSYPRHSHSSHNNHKVRSKNKSQHDLRLSHKSKRCSHQKSSQPSGKERKQKNISDMHDQITSCGNKFPKTDKHHIGVDGKELLSQDVNTDVTSDRKYRNYRSGKYRKTRGAVRVQEKEQKRAKELSSIDQKVQNEILEHHVTSAGKDHNAYDCLHKLDDKINLTYVENVLPICEALEWSNGERQYNMGNQSEQVFHGGGIWKSIIQEKSIV